LRGRAKWHLALAGEHAPSELRERLVALVEDFVH
jgi:hypothetical protein